MTNLYPSNEPVYRDPDDDRGTAVDQSEQDQGEKFSYVVLTQHAIIDGVKFSDRNVDTGGFGEPVQLTEKYAEQLMDHGVCLSCLDDKPEANEATGDGEALRPVR